MTRSRKPSDIRKKICRKPRRNEPNAILIVTEGKKTEKEYFNCLINQLRVGADVNFPRNGNSAPVSIVNRARKEIERDSSRYEIIYCVFDKDDRSISEYDEAISMIKKLNRTYQNIKISAVPSVPSIEYWFYLHADYLDKPYSNARELEKDLKRIPQFSKYNKSIPSDLFKYLFDNRKTAKGNAARSLKDGKHRGEKTYHENPSTRIHVILSKLEKFSSIP